MTIGIIVCKISKYWEECISKVLEHKGNHELIILFNGCDLETGDFQTLQFPTLQNCSIARNEILLHATSDTILWIDDDILVCENFAQPFEDKFAEDIKIGSVGYDTARISDDFLTPTHIDPAINSVDYLDSPYAVRKSMIIDIGKYDENLEISCNTTDLHLRAIASSWQIGIIKNPGIIHMMGATRDILKQRDDIIDRDWIYMLHKHRVGWRRRYKMEWKDTIIFKKSLQYKPNERRPL